jgi:ATP-dependent protease ClpP protease subunit
MTGPKKRKKKMTNDDIEQFMDNELYLPTRTIYMGSQTYVEGCETGVDHLMAERMIKTLHILDMEDPEGNSPITIIMNNIGGDWYHGMAIYDTIQNCVNPVHVKVYGYAMSMGSIILQACDHRSMAKNARIMLHYGQSGSNDHTKTTIKYANEDVKLNKWMEDMFLEKIGDGKLTLRKYNWLIDKVDRTPKGGAGNKQMNITRDNLEAMMNFDSLIDCKDALSLNLIDEIIQSKKKKA